MKLLILLGGPFHSHSEWRTNFPDPLEMRHDDGLMFPTIHTYRLAFGDDYVGIYYWRLNDQQVKKVQEQVIELRRSNNESY